MSTAPASTLMDPVREAMTQVRVARMRLVEVVAEVVGSDAASVVGYRGPHRLLEDLCRLDAGDAARLVSDAQALVAEVSLTGETLPPRLPATAALAADGVVGEQHVRVIDRAMDAVARVPGLEPGTVAAAEAALAAQARVLPPRAVDRAAARLLAHLDPDGVAPVEPPEPEDEMSLRRRRDGAIAFAGLVHGRADGEMLLEVIDALAVPAGPDDARPLGRRRAEALLDLAAQALTGATPDPLVSDDHLAAEPAADDEPAAGDAPATGDEPAGVDDSTDAQDPVAAAPGADALGAARATARGRRAAPVTGRAMLAVTIDLEALRTQRGRGLLDSDVALGAAAARRLACDAGIVPVVLGTRSEPLDLGRAVYAAPDALRRALHLRDRGCSFPGCTRRPRRCHAHHVRSWVDGGETALHNMTLLCRFHHHLVHHGDWTVVMRGGRPWFLPPRWVDPDRRPRPGGGHPPDPTLAPPPPARRRHRHGPPARPEAA